MGLLQGLTEFFPISSSGHLVAAKALFRVGSPPMLLEISLHFGTLLSVLLVLHRDVVRLLRDAVRGLLLCTSAGGRQRIQHEAPLFRTAVAVALGTLPAAFAGVVLGGRIAPLFESLRASGLFIFVTGLIVLSSCVAPRGTERSVTVTKGLLIGLAQALALLPGISRSGSTIAAALFLRIEREAAARFSFLLAIPAIAGATAWKLMQLSRSTGALQHVGEEAAAILCGIAVSALVGAVCLHFVIRIAAHGGLHWFSVYCVPAGIVLFALSF